MEVSITHFRKDLFCLVDQAQRGTEIWVRHKGSRFRIIPESEPRDRLSQLTPLDLINSDFAEVADSSLLGEMASAWEKDWATL